MLLVSLISYIDRNTLALLAPTILADCGLSGEQYGWIISSFSVAYMAGNPLWGRWLDKWGVRNGMLAEWWWISRRPELRAARPAVERIDWRDGRLWGVMASYALGWECGYFLWGWMTDRLRQGERDPLRVYRWMTLAAAVGTLPLAMAS